MGQPKFAIDLRGRTLLRRCLDTLAAGGASPILVVGRTDSAAALALAAGPDVIVAINPDPDRGMLSSVHAGLRTAADNPSAPAGDLWCYVLPVDCPAVLASTCALLSAAVHGTEAAAAIPEHRGRRGHPVLLGPEVARSVREAVEADGGGTLAQVLAAFGERVCVVPVDDSAVTDNVNRPGDVQRLRERLQEEDGR